MSERWLKNVKKRRYLLIGINVGAAALVGLAALAGTKGDAFSILKPGAKDLQALEKAAATDPTPAHIGTLASSYLEAKQPGLAVALMESHPEAQTPELSILRGRAYYANGRASRALAVIDELTATCASASMVCPQWVRATGLADQAYFSELVSAGIEDAAANPVEAQAAFTRSRQEIHLVAIR